MKKLFIIAAVIISTITANAQNIISNLSKHPNISRITELCVSYDNMQFKSDCETDSSIKAVYSKYMLQTLEQIGAIYLQIDYPTPEMSMPLFNIGFDIKELYDKVVKKLSNGGSITNTDIALVRAIEKDIDDNISRI